MEWNLGDLLDGVGAVLPPEAPALIHGDSVLSWGELTARSDNLARHWVEQGASPGDKVAFYMRNRVEYLVTLVAAFKARLVHVNVNYRYLEDSSIGSSTCGIGCRR
jgi:fatty-acyl-CoA synthase